MNGSVGLGCVVVDWGLGGEEGKEWFGSEEPSESEAPTLRLTLRAGARTCPLTQRSLAMSKTEGDLTTRLSEKRSMSSWRC